MAGRTELESFVLGQWRPAEQQHSFLIAPAQHAGAVAIANMEGVDPYDRAWRDDYAAIHRDRR